MRPVSLATPFLLYLTLASGQANHSAKYQITITHSGTTNLPSLTTTFSAGPFSFIIPYGQSQQCNIFGPICQTGHITVGVSLASSTTTTTLPCSSYLTSQAAHLLSGKLESGGVITLQDALEWLTAFGRSPECRSYAEVYQNEAQYTFSDCGTRNTIIQASQGFSLPTQIPPAVVDRFRPLDYACCGNCTLIVPEVRLFYFPDQVAPQCAGQPSNSSAIVSARAINKRVQSLNHTGSIAVLSGHTFTSPSVYLQVVGTVAIKDECGFFGPILTSPIITLPPNVLSTYIPPTYSIGSIYTDPNVQVGHEGFVGQAEPLKIADLQCPTFGLGIGTSADGSVYTTVGPPWHPIIIPPREVFTLDPTWESVCTELASYYVFESFAIFDPPYALAPESYLVAPSPAASSPQLKSPPNVSANPTAASDPLVTDQPDLSDPTNLPVKSIAPSVDVQPAAIPQDPVVKPTTAPETPVSTAQPAAVPVESAAKPIAAPETPVNTAQPAAVPVESAAKPIAAPETPVNTAQPAAVPLDPAVKPTAAPDLPRSSVELQPGSPSLAPSIFSALGHGGPQSSGSGIADPTHIISVPGSGIEAVTVGGQVLSISPSGVYLSGTSYSPQGPAITLSSGVFSLISTFPAREASDEDPSINDQPFTPSIQTIADHNVVSNTLGVYVADSKLSPGGCAITASNTMISLSPAGTLVIGSSIIPLSLADTRGTFPTKLNLDGVTIQAESSAAVVDGVTLTPGGTEIDGNSIDLERGGTLVVGTSHIVLPTGQETTPSVLSLDDMAVQLDSSAVLIDGTTLTPGGPSVSINGNRVSLGRDRSLDIGTSHFALPPAAQETTPRNGFKLNGLTVQARQSPVVVNGVTLTPGEPGTTINGSSVSLEPSGTLDIGTGRFAIPTGPVNGSSVSLEPSGTLDIGTGRFAIPTGPVNGTSILQTFESAQEKAHQLPRLLYLTAIVVPGLWMVVS